MLPAVTHDSSGFSRSSPAVEAAGQEITSRNLAAGEIVQWLGRPNPRKHFTASDRFLIPFSLFWAGFTIFWEATAASGGAGAFFVLWGIPFVLIGFYMTIGRFIWKARRKKRTVYVVTDRRVMSIVAGRNGDSVEASYLRALPGISTSTRSDGTGTVTFGTNSVLAGMYANSGMEFFARGAQSGNILSFYDLENAREVADLVEELREKALISPPN